MVVAIQIATAAYAFLFAGAALGKLDAWNKWSHVVASFLPGSARLANFVRVGVPVLEAGLVVSLLFLPIPGLVLAGAVLAAFAAAAALLARSHRGAECSCFGALASSEIGWRLVARNTLAASIAFVLAAGARNTAVASGGLGRIGLVVAVGALLALLVEYRRFRGFLTPESERTA